MSKYCPILNRKVVYLDCLECDEKICQKETMDQSKTNQIRAKGRSSLSTQKENAKEIVS